MQNLIETRQRQATRRMYEDVQKEHARLMAITEHGVQKYHDKWIIGELAHKFYKSPATIEKIIYNRNNLNLF
ncbi:hypothetical protein ETU10_07255 [Apibacter muscae]|uniref:hypothetical protein n=1 Tax=Apibacter muscae TaxID=2509004 RepID=UPI0011AD5680|nr:hypothetical protein [Apibacter muscae]TWP23513.1 hypothetical protein ETU10_07255 [Apibacter muscae]